MPDRSTNTRLFEAWARDYVREIASPSVPEAYTLKVGSERAWSAVLDRHLSTSPAAFSATEPDEPHYRAAFYVALTAAIVSHAEAVAARADSDIADGDGAMREALTTLIAKANGFDASTITALRLLRRRDPMGPFSMLRLP